MSLDIDDFAVAVRAGASWGLLKAAEKPGTGDYAAAIRAGSRWIAAKAFKPEEGKYALALRGTPGLPNVVRLEKPEEEEEEEPPDPPDPPDPNWPPKPDPGCRGHSPYCMRIPCIHWIKTKYYISFSNWTGAAESLNGVIEVNWTGDCVWNGSGGGWDIELDFPLFQGTGKWFVYAANGSADLYIATPRHTDYEPEGVTLWMVNHLSDGVTHEDGVLAVISS